MLTNLDRIQFTITKPDPHLSMMMEININAIVIDAVVNKVEIYTEDNILILLQPEEIESISIQSESNLWLFAIEEQRFKEIVHRLLNNNSQVKD